MRHAFLLLLFLGANVGCVAAQDQASIDSAIAAASKDPSLEKLNAAWDAFKKCKSDDSPAMRRWNLDSILAVSRIVLLNYDPNWKAAENIPASQVVLPDKETQIDPEQVEDPEVRKAYSAAIKANEAKTARVRYQDGLSDLLRSTQSQFSSLLRRSYFKGEFPEVIETTKTVLGETFAPPYLELIEAARKEAGDRPPSQPAKPEKPDAEPSALLRYSQ